MCCVSSETKRILWLLSGYSYMNILCTVYNSTNPFLCFSIITTTGLYSVSRCQLGIVSWLRQADRHPVVFHLWAEGQGRTRLRAPRGPDPAHLWGGLRRSTTHHHLHTRQGLLQLCCHRHGNTVDHTAGSLGLWRHLAVDWEDCRSQMRHLFCQVWYVTCVFKTLL